jgi:hypothetical protein
MIMFLLCVFNAYSRIAQTVTDKEYYPIIAASLTTPEGRASGAGLI